MARTIQELRDLLDPTDYRPTDTETLYVTEGVVTTSINLTTSSNQLYYIQEGDFGIAVFHRDQPGEGIPNQGDRVRITAPLAHFNGLLELVPDADEAETGVVVLATNQDLPEPLEFTFDNIENPDVMEDLEARLIRISDATIDRSNGETFPAPSGNLTLTDEIGREFTLRVDSRTDIGGKAIPEGTVSIVGVVGQFDTSDPRSAGYQILPDSFDHILTPFKAPEITFSNRVLNQQRPVYPAENDYRELPLRLGETLIIDVEVFDGDGKEISLQEGGSLPSNASWTIAERSGEVLTARFEVTVTEANLGTVIAPMLMASNDVAANEFSWTIYVPSLQEHSIAITEFLANPTAEAESAFYNPLGRMADQLVDSSYNPRSHDEFVEIGNYSDSPVELGGWTLSDRASLRHQFFNSFIVAPGSAGIIYGGPLNGLVPSIDVPSTPASQNEFLGFNNGGGDDILLRNAEGNLVDFIAYQEEELSSSSSLSLFPDLSGRFVAQEGLTGEASSPGLNWDGVSGFDLDSEGQSVEGVTLSVSVLGDGLTVAIEWPLVAGSSPKTYVVWKATSVDGDFTPVAVLGSQEGPRVRYAEQSTLMESYYWIEAF